MKPWSLFTILTLVVLPGRILGQEDDQLISSDYADQLRNTVTWEVADPNSNVLAGKSKADFKKMLMTKVPAEVKNLQAKFSSGHSEAAAAGTGSPEDQVAKGSSLPESFDGRTVWGKCIHSGRDQGECGGCWAFGLTNHLSDRFCIWGVDVVLSVQDLIECDGRSRCCSGGTDYNGYRFLTEQGVFSEKCRPYDMRCGLCRKPRYTSCRRYKCKKNSMWFSSNVEAAKSEIYKNGPIQGVYNVYSDFPNYKGGVYYQTSKDFLGVHTVEILGWGKENGVDYWLAKNCWGDTWGMKSFFKIKMGECGINDNMSTCRPLVTSRSRY